MKLIELRTEFNRILSENPDKRRKIRALTKLKWIESAYTFDKNSFCGDDVLEINDIQNIIKNGFIDSKSLGDHIIVKKYYDMINYLYEITSIRYNIDLKVIEKINVMLGRDGTMEEGAVKYRKEETPFVARLSRIAPEPDLINPQMQRFIRDYEEVHGKYNPVRVGCYVHNELLRIYPFEKNNESTARALLNFELISAGYLPIVFKMDYEKYYEAVKIHINEDDGRPFYELILEMEKEVYIKYIDLLSD